MQHPECPQGQPELQAVRRAVRGLVGQVNRQGLWEAFQLRPGGSSTWTSAVVLHAIGAAFRLCPDLITVPLLQRSWSRAWRWFESQGSAGIGFNPFTPHDADSTIWLRRALQQRQLLGFQLSSDLLPWQQELEAYIESHVQAQGVQTYGPDDGILAYVGLPPDAPSSWLRPHGCVTLNHHALNTELEGSAVGRSWRSMPSETPFWWQESSIGAWLLSSAVGFDPCGPDWCQHLGQSLQPPAQLQTPDELIDALLSRQLPSGLWSPLFTLRIPDHTDQTGGATEYNFECDTESGLCRDNGLFSSALLLASLSVTLRCRLAHAV